MSCGEAALYPGELFSAWLAGIEPFCYLRRCPNLVYDDLLINRPLRAISHPDDLASSGARDNS